MKRVGQMTGSEFLRLPVIFCCSCGYRDRQNSTVARPLSAVTGRLAIVPCSQRIAIQLGNNKETKHSKRITIRTLYSSRLRGG